MWPFNKKRAVPGENWLYWDYYDPDGLYGMTFIDGQFLEPQNRKAFLREVQISLVFPDALLVKGSFPSPEGHDQARALEDRLEKSLEKARVECVMSARCTYDGTRRFVFEVMDMAAFDRVVYDWQGQLGPFEPHRREEPAWTVYEELSPDEFAWHRMNNRELIERLVEAGLDPEQKHLLEFGFSGDDRARSAFLSRAEAVGGRSLGTSEGTLDVGFDRELDLDRICDLQDELLFIAEETGTKYEGWSVTVRKH